MLNDEVASTNLELQVIGANDGKRCSISGTVANFDFQQEVPNFASTLDNVPYYEDGLTTLIASSKSAISMSRTSSAWIFAVSWPKPRSGPSGFVT